MFAAFIPGPGPHSLGQSVEWKLGDLQTCAQGVAANPEAPLAGAIS